MDNKKKKIITGVFIIALLIAFGIGMFVIGGNESEDVSAKDDKKVVKEEKTSAESVADETKGGAKEDKKEDKSNKGSSKNNSGSTNKTGQSSNGHKHKWVAQYEEQDNGYYEYVYETKYWHECNACGTDITGNIEGHHKSGCMSGWTTKSKDILVDTIWHSDVEKVYIGDKCSSCGEWR